MMAMTIKHVNLYYCDNPIRDQRILHRIIPEARKNCPECGRKMHIFGNAQRLDYKYNCSSCGYYGPMLSKDELHQIL
jgi:predicted RNA-binding Zn-ribbon protein involved in translation (DUF1610 family)